MTSTTADEPFVDLTTYALRPADYIRDLLGWEPWSGELGHAGQVEILDAYAQALDAQLRRSDDVVRNRIRIEAGHTVGKTKLAAGIVNHFFDCFTPAICYTYAPSYEQIHDLLWKEIKGDRRGRGLPGRILDLELSRSDKHFAKGRATNNAHGQGTERTQGQHGPYLLFVLDEAEGIESYVFDAIESMTSGGLSIVLMLANPRTRSSRFHRAAADPRVASFRLSCLYHPNVLHDDEVVPGAVMRQYVESMIDNGAEQHCEIVREHDDDLHTFELPWRQGTIYRPDAEFLFRVMGIAPAHITDNTFVPPGRYEAATLREAIPAQPDSAFLGVDVARYGKDFGTIYCRHAGRLYRVAQIAQEDTNAYARLLRQHCLLLAQSGVRHVEIRIDAGGGYGGGVADRLATDAELHWSLDTCAIYEVHFNGTPHDVAAYADTATELYAHAAQALRVLSLVDAPAQLEADLCERTYTWTSERGVDVKKLTPKEVFKRQHGRSPDDGDGAALACAPSYILTQHARAWQADDLRALAGGTRL